MKFHLSWVCQKLQLLGPGTSRVVMSKEECKHILCKINVRNILKQTWDYAWLPDNFLVYFTYLFFISSCVVLKMWQPTCLFLFWHYSLTKQGFWPTRTWNSLFERDKQFPIATSWRFHLANETISYRHFKLDRSRKFPQH